MQSKSRFASIHNVITILLLLGVMFSTFGVASLPNARAYSEEATKTSPTEVLYLWSPVSNLVLYWSLNSAAGGPGLRPYDLNLYNAETDQGYILAKDGYAGFAKFSTDGSTLSFWYNNSPYLVNLSGSTFSAIRVETDVVPVKGAFSASNDLLIYATKENEIRVRDLTNSLETSLGNFADVSTLPYLSPEWSPDDQWVAFASKANGLLIDPTGVVDPIILPDLSYPQSEFSSAVHFFVWSDAGSALYDYSGKLVHTFTSPAAPAPSVEPQHLSFDGAFEVLSSDGELFLQRVISASKKQLTNNRDTVAQLLEPAPKAQINSAVTALAAVANGFDYPVGKPDGAGYNTTAGCWWLQRDGACAPGPHPGQDFNGNGGGDTDLNDPVYAAANGTVVYSADAGSPWGNIILIQHTLPDNSQVWSQYAHLNSRGKSVGDTVNKGDQIGLIGKGGWAYAHLHFEIRIQYRAADAWITGWSDDQVRQYYVNPSDYINSHRTITVGSCPTVSGEVKLYDLTNCGGSSATANATGLWDMASAFNDQAESIAIPSGWSARLYQNNNENTSESACFSSTDTNLNDNTFANGGTVGNQSTWMRVYNNSNCSGTTPPNAPGLSTPGNGSSNPYNYDLTFQWNSASGATEYLVEWWGGPYGTMQPCGWSGSTSCHIGTVAAGNTYSWHVKARNSAGESGWSSTWAFTVQQQVQAPSAPSLSSPGNGSGNPYNYDLTFQWNSSSGATEYLVEWWGGPYGTMQPCGWNGSTSCHIGTVAAGNTYSWHVKARNSAGESGWSGTWTFTIQSQAKPSANFDAWPLGGSAPFTTAFHIVDMSNITSCSWNYGDGQTSTTCTQLHNHTYNSGGSYTVSLTVNGPGGSDSLTRQNYITVTAPPNPPTLSTPGNGSSNPSDYDLTFQWNPSSGATEYLIEWWGGPYSTMQPCGWSSATSCHIGQVIPGNTYSWHVKARNSAGESGWSSTRTFTIQNGSTPDLVIQSITASPSNPAVNQPVTFTIRIKNQGAANVTSGFYVDFYVDQQPLTDCTDTGTNFWSMISLAAGATQDLTYTHPSFSSSGAHTLYAFADTNCYIPESNENNNILGPITLNVQTGTSGNGADTTGVFRPSNGLLYLKNQNTTGFADIAINYGMGGDYPVVGDWDGNGTATIGVYRSGKFYLRNTNTLGFADMVFAFGQIGDQPIAGDWNGDGIDTIGIFRPSTGLFMLRNSNTAGTADTSFYLGNVGDVGIAGDWNGDGIDTTGVFRPINGIIFLKNTNTTGFADIALNYGIPGDRPVTGDWDGNGTDTIGVYRNAQFYLRNSNTIGFADIVFGLGIPGDMPIAGNWDGMP